MTIPEPSAFAQSQGARLVPLMQELVGSHYVFGATGDVAAHGFAGGSSDNNGMPREGREPGTLIARVVHMLPNDPAFDAAGQPRGAHRPHGPRVEGPNLFAAYTNINFPTVCCGRAWEVRRRYPSGVPNRLQPNLEQIRERSHAPQMYLWPRTYRRGAGGAAGPLFQEEGESCLGKRHFDCIGFVGFCFWRITGQRRQRSIAAWRTMGEGLITIQGPDTEEMSPRDLRAGDIVITPDSHISLATGAGSVIEAESEERGVKENHPTTLAGKIIRRPSDSFWGGH